MKVIALDANDVGLSKVQCRLEFTYDTPESSQKILSSVELENYPYVEARLEGSTLISKTSADSLESLIHTLEDYLSCISVAERVLGEA